MTQLAQGKRPSCRLRGASPIALTMLFAAPLPASAQEQAQPPAIDADAAAPADQVTGQVSTPADAAPPKKESKFHQRFFDDEDGKFDFSNFLAKGGFIPMPVIVTEPAVKGGFGVVAQFITMPEDDPRNVTRRMLGGVKTGNGSYGFGYFQSGNAIDGLISYKFGIGHGKITLDAHPSFLDGPLSYTNKYKYGILGSMLVHLPDRRFSMGPMIDFRKLQSSVDFANPLPIDRDFGRTLTTGAMGFGVHFDSRDNKMTPTKGVNAYVQGKFNSEAFGSDRTFQTYDADLYAFRPLSPKWRLGYKAEYSAIRGDFPIYFGPAINLRGVEAQRYQGSSVFSTEVELTRQLSPRWALLAFGGVGTASAGDRRLFDDSGAIFAGGAGFRYRIARKLGLDAGIDVAVGPGGGVFYLQFGHAWSFGMD